MKTLFTVLLAAGLAVSAHGREPESGKRTLVVLKTKPRTVTGSNVARPVRRIGNTYDTPQTIHVIDRTEIERSGASNVAQLLRRYPSVSIR